MRCRKSIWNDDKQCYNIVWFGSKGKNADGTAIFCDEGEGTRTISENEYQYNTTVDDKKIVIIKPDIAKELHNNYAKDKDAIVNSLRQRLSTMKNELWYDYLYGLPLLQRGVTKAMIDSEAMMMIEGTPGVNSLISFKSEVDKANHEYKLNFVVDTIYGNVSISV